MKAVAPDSEVSVVIIVGGGDFLVKEINNQISFAKKVIYLNVSEGFHQHPDIEIDENTNNLVIINGDTYLLYEKLWAEINEVFPLNLD